ncbi:MAG TPA: PAS domain S-box protein [Methanoregula sp.]|nr:PAS domain S-box protein [Methanoregula sp.]
MQRLSGENEEILQLFILAAACIGAILTTIFSLTHGIFEVFSFLYILPIILCVYFYPKRAVFFTLAISLTYIGQIYLLGSANTSMIAAATAWFAIFMIIGVVASSYANRMHDERIRVRNILENSQDGILCFDRESLTILELNGKFSRWLRYDTEELIGSELSQIWCDSAERERFVAGIRKNGKDTSETEGLFRAKDGTILRFVLSVILVSKNRVFCSIVDITGSKIVDEEIRRTLEDLEAQVKARTAHLERINEDLRREILEQRQYEQTLLPAQADENRARGGEEK